MFIGLILKPSGTISTHTHALTYVVDDDIAEEARVEHRALQATDACHEGQRRVQRLSESKYQQNEDYGCLCGESLLSLLFTLIVKTTNFFGWSQVILLI